MRFKGQISLNYSNKSVSKIFIRNVVCVLANERYKTYLMGFSFQHMGHAQGVGVWGTGGAQRGKINLEHGHVVYQIDGDDEQNKMQVKF